MSKAKPCNNVCFGVVVVFGCEVVDKSLAILTVETTGSFIGMGNFGVIG